MSPIPQSDARNTRETGSSNPTELDADEFTPDPDGRERPRDPARIAARAKLASVITAMGDLPDGIIVLESWNGSWTEPLADAWPALAQELQEVGSDCPHPDGRSWRHNPWLVVGREAESRRRLDRESDEAVEAAWRGRNVCLVSSAPERYFAADVMRAADHRIVLGPLEPDELGEIAKAVTADKPSITLGAAVCIGVTPTMLRLACRASQSADDFLRRVAALAQADGAARDTPVHTLDDLHGMGEAVAWGRDLAADLSAYRAGGLKWSAVDRGCVLVGAPGTGKTTFVQALARTCGVPLISASYARWQAARDGHLGDLLRAMADFFDTARKSAPCIAFIDELDSFHPRTGESRHRDWWTAVVNALLEHLDGVEKREGVVVIGATNHLALVDPAIIRSGRLDRTVYIPLPDQAALAGIFRVHLGHDLAGTDLMPVALHAAGATGADCERWVRGARRRARHRSRAMVVGDLLAEVSDLGDRRSDEFLHTVAVHEAGHALLLAREQPGALQHVSIVHHEGSHGEVAGLVEGVTLDEVTLGSALRSLLAGRAAEHVVFGRVTAGSGGPAGSDLARATYIALAAETALGFSEQPLLWRGLWDGNAVGPVLLGHSRLAERVNARLEAAWSEVCAVLQARRAVLDEIVRRLLARGALSGDEVEAMVTEHTFEGGESS